MALIKYFDKRVGITYVYESESYYDKEKHQSRSRRKLVGKIDPQTGEVVPTGNIGRPPKNPEAAKAAGDADYKKMYEKELLSNEKKDQKIASLEAELNETKTALLDYQSMVKKIADICSARK